MQSLLNTVIFVVGTLPFTIGIALFFAALLSNAKRLQSFFQSALASEVEFDCGSAALGGT